MERFKRIVLRYKRGPNAGCYAKLKVGVPSPTTMLQASNFVDVEQARRVQQRFPDIFDVEQLEVSIKIKKIG